ncbi:hypothetical protein, partial [Klebsiella aerogenes]|uniref:hypothetical protein n=1 Tax=Klebsiella aerogenes TaxID=548 RepID=UPI0019540383
DCLSSIALAMGSVLSTYFWALLALLSMLVFREAAMLLLVIVIPLFVGLSFLDTFRKVAILE